MGNISLLRTTAIINLLLIGGFFKSGGAHSFKSVLDVNLYERILKTPVLPDYPSVFFNRQNSYTLFVPHIPVCEPELDTLALACNIKAEKKYVKYNLPNGAGFIRRNGSVTWRNMNPGAIRYTNFAKNNGAIGKANGFAVFPTEERGELALRELLQTATYSKLTLSQAIYRFAPPKDRNNTASYQRHVAQLTRIKPYKKLKNLTAEELDRVIATIRYIEGWKPGTENDFMAPVMVVNDSLQNIR